jgi:hypothetical protein
MIARTVLVLMCLLAVGAAEEPATRPSTTGTVTGVAVDAGGNPVAECVVSATESGQRMRVARTAETDADGKFSLDLPEGSWSLTVTTKDTKLKGVKSVDTEAGKTFDVGKIPLRPRKVGAR